MNFSTDYSRGIPLLQIKSKGKFAKKLKVYFCLGFEPVGKCAEMVSQARRDWEEIKATSAGCNYIFGISNASLQNVNVSKLYWNTRGLCTKSCTDTHIKCCSAKLKLLSHFLFLLLLHRYLHFLLNSMFLPSSVVCGRTVSLFPPCPINLCCSFMYGASPFSKLL